MRTYPKWTAPIATLALVFASPQGAADEWPAAQRANFIHGCVNAAKTPKDQEKMTEQCTCMAQQMEAQVSPERLAELSAMPEGKERDAALLPLLQEAKVKCESREK
jgi:hypothetical protein